MKVEVAPEDLEPGQEVVVCYRSSRSGNEVERAGDVEAIQTPDEDVDGHNVIVHVEEPEPFTHRYVAAFDPTDEDAVGGVISVTTEPEVLTADGHARGIGRTFTVKNQVARTVKLGALLRIEREAGTYLVT